MTSGRSERWQVEVEARLARLELRADEAEVAAGGFAYARRSGSAPAADYPDLDTWVRDYFCATFERPLGGEFRWCPQWREHREAVARLDALWSSWKGLQRDPVMGMSTWFHLYLDAQLGVLLSARGPFMQCSPARHEGAVAPPMTGSPDPTGERRVLADGTGSGSSSRSERHA